MEGQFPEHTKDLSSSLQMWQVPVCAQSGVSWRQPTSTILRRGRRKWSVWRAVNPP
jgi:hypothetical protein